MRQIRLLTSFLWFRGQKLLLAIGESFLQTIPKDRLKLKYFKNYKYYYERKFL